MVCFPDDLISSISYCYYEKIKMVSAMHNHHTNLFLIALFFASSVLLTSCGHLPQTDESETFPSKGLSADFQFRSSTDHEIQMLTSPDGFALDYATGSENGAYLSLQLKDEIAFNIAYIDYATQNEVLLCSKPNCSHDDATCTSWVPQNGYGQLITDGKHLFCFINDTQNGPAIYRMDMNGENRKKLYTFQSGGSFFSGVASDGTYLYFGSSQISEEGKSSGYIVALSCESGEMFTISEFAGESYLYSAFGRTLIIRHTVDTGEVEFIGIDVDSGEKTILRTWNPIHEFGLCDKDTYVCLDVENYIIRVCSLKSGEEYTFSNIIPQIDEDCICILNGLLDNHIWFTIYTPSIGSILMDTKTYAVDIASGLVTDIDFKIDNLGYTTDPVDIVAQTDDFYLVRTSIKQFDLTMRTYDGTMATKTLPQACFSIIMKDDFWKGRPNFTPIQSTVFY